MNFEQLVKYMAWLASKLAMIPAYSQATDYTLNRAKEDWNFEKVSEKLEVTINDLKKLSENELFMLGFRIWEGNKFLFPLWMFKLIKHGEEVISINNEKYIIGTDEVDLDVRANCLAFGFIRN